MKTNIITKISLATLAFAGFIGAACSSDDEQKSTATLTLAATKKNYDSGTRAISYVNPSDPTKGITTTWATTDKVAVYSSGWAGKIGDLSPMDGKTEGNKTKLDGNVSPDNLKIGERTELIFPRTTWSYADQDGTLATISSKYDYAIASAQVTFIDQNNKIYASDAMFVTQQAIVRYIITDGGSPLNVNSMTIVAASGKLVKSRTLDGTSVEYGGLEIKPASATNVLDVAIRNDFKEGDKYTLTVKAGDKIYSSTSKNAHTYAWGKFIIHEVDVNFVDDTHTERDTYQYQGIEEW